MGTEGFDAQQYAKVLSRKVLDATGIRLEVHGLAGGGGPFYSTLDKRLITTGAQRLITSATVCLNYGRINTKTRVRAALAHEIAHLIPGDATLPLKERWRTWWKILNELDKI